MSFKQVARLTLAIAFTLTLTTGCSKKTGGNVSLNVNPVAGPSAARVNPLDHFFSIMGIQSALASVSTFNSFYLCNDTLVMKNVSGETVKINGLESEVGVGLLTVSPTATTAMNLASLNIAAGTQIKEIYITSAVNPTLCNGVNYAVQFDPGSGAINITQNTQFKFTYSSPVTISGDAQELTVLFGAIIDAMVGQGAGLSNSSIQLISVNGTAR